MNGSEVTEIRKVLGFSQAEFARQFEINIHTLRQWERKDNPLDSTTAAYLTCIKRDAQQVMELLHGQEQEN